MSTVFRLGGVHLPGGSCVPRPRTYYYDADNNVSKFKDVLTAANTQTLGYDVLDRLTSATGNYGSLAYTYSPIGNRLTQTSGGALTSYSYAPNSNQLAGIASGGSTQTLTTTAAGNISGFSSPFGPITGLTYNQANRLATVSAGASQLTQYTYNAFGQRIVKQGSATGTTVYQYDSVTGHLLEENDGAGNARVDYVYLNDQPVATIQPSNGAVYYLFDDRLGTPQLATDISQNVQWTASYQPFGYTSTGVGLIVQNLRLPRLPLTLSGILSSANPYSPALQGAANNAAQSVLSIAPTITSTGVPDYDLVTQRASTVYTAGNYHP